MTPELQAMLDEHIPYRLTTIDCLRWACEILRSGQNPTRVDLTFDSTPVITSGTYRFLTNPMVEMGAIYCRVLLEFLGLAIDPAGDSLRSVRDRKPDDVGIEHFGLGRLTVQDVRGAAPEAPWDAERACVVTIQIAHKAVAHLTTGHKPDADLHRLYLCSSLVPMLVVKHLYAALNRPAPRYKVGRAG